VAIYKHLWGWNLCSLYKVIPLCTCAYHHGFAILLDQFTPQKSGEVSTKNAPLNRSSQTRREGNVFKWKFYVMPLIFIGLWPQTTILRRMWRDYLLSWLFPRTKWELEKGDLKLRIKLIFWISNFEFFQIWSYTNVWYMKIST
jgi:hypothetical protein